MEAAPKYLLIWAIYLLASAGFFWIYWKVTAFKRQIWLSYSLRALMLALVLTPWYANTQGDVYAPALMVVTLDAITLGLDTIARALAPLLISLIAAEILATIAWLVHRNKKKRVKTEA
jgi:hypothetical protein